MSDQQGQNINAQGSQGFVNQPSGPVTQHFHAPTPEQRLHQLRAPVADFVGREQEIAELRQALTGGSGATICGVRGMGGIGKTELAMVVANQLAERFPDGQLVVELFGASDPDSITPEAALQAAIRSFEPQAKLPDDLPTLKQWYAACLNGKRVLVLADDARDAAQVRPLHPPARCALLVTSRHSFTLPGMRRFDLGTLDPAEAEGLLLEIEPRIGEHAPALAKLCGYLPLALRVSATLLANDDTRSVPRYLEQLRAERLRHLADPDGDPDDPAASVEASLALSYEALPAEAQQAFAQLGVFVGDFPLEAAEAVVQMPDTPSPIPDTLSLLRRRSLLEYDAASERYDLHDLARAFALARLPDERPARLRHARYYEQIAYHADKELYKKGQVLEGLALFDREQRQIDAGWQWAMQDSRYAIADSRNPDTEIDNLLLDFANATAYVGDVRYDLRRERIPQLEAQAAAARRLGQRQQEGNALGNLGLAYLYLGEYQRAIAYYEQALVISREIGDRRGEGTALGNLGLAYYSLGEYQRAIETLEQRLVIAREIGDRRGEGTALGNLGLAYANLGDYQRAIEYYEQALAVMRDLGDRRAEGSILGNLGSAYYSLGEYQRAIETLEQALVISREIGDRRGEGSDLGNLGLAYADLGEYQRAIAYYEQALVISREIGDIAGVARNSWNLGLLYEQQGELARAEPLMAHAAAFMAQIGHAQHAKLTADKLTEVRAKLAGGGGA
jgi:tetratricopeptide (TPR) repeat protein